MKNTIRKTLTFFNLTEKVRWSEIYRQFLHIRDTKLREKEKKELQFLKKIIPQGAFCFDIGANVGEKTRLFLKNKCQVICVEPDISNVKILQTRFGKNKSVHILGVAISDKKGLAKLHIIHEGSAYNTLSDKWIDSLEKKERNRWQKEMKASSSYDVTTTTLNSIIAKYGMPFYIKIDVEGLEEKVVRGLSHPISLISFEANLPEFTKETINCVKHQQFSV